jgi:hypothetical protein
LVIRCLSLSEPANDGGHAERESRTGLLAVAAVEPLLDGGANEVGHRPVVFDVRCLELAIDLGRQTHE